MNAGSLLNYVVGGSIPPCTATFMVPRDSSPDGFILRSAPDRGRDSGQH